MTLEEVIPRLLSIAAKNPHNINNDIRIQIHYLKLEYLSSHNESERLQRLVALRDAIGKNAPVDRARCILIDVLCDPERHLIVRETTVLSDA